MLHWTLHNWCFNANKTLRFGVQPSRINAAFIMSKPVIPPDALDRFRNAAAHFAHHAASRASRLSALKDDIAALRNRGVSYRAIGELLTQSGIAASNTSVMRFCHRVLKERRSRKPSVARRAAPDANRHTAPESAPAAAPKVASASAPTASSNIPSASTDDSPFRSRGPHIAKVELLPPGEQL
jgi:hypothetical protein